MVALRGYSAKAAACQADTRQLAAYQHRGLQLQTIYAWLTQGQRRDRGKLDLVPGRFFEVKYDAGRGLPLAWPFGKISFKYPRHLQSFTKSRRCDLPLSISSTWI
jgi:hypothetical protein